MRRNITNTFSWRDLRAAPFRALATITLLAFASAALYTTTAIGRETGSFLEEDPRTWLGGDVIAAMGGPAQPEQLDAIGDLPFTVSVETVSMVASRHAPDPAVVLLRAVDPAAYPWYGQVAVNPPQPFRLALNDNTCLVTPGVLQRLHITIGDTLRAGAAHFTVAGILAVEPDRLSSLHTAFPRVMISQAGFARARIALHQSRMVHRYLFRRPNAITLDSLSHRVRTTFPEATVSDHQHADPRVARVFETVIATFRFSAATALLLAAFGTGLLLYAHLERRLDTVAILKTLGAPNAWIRRAYLLQAALLASTGLLPGLGLGHLSTLAIAALERSQLALPVHGAWSPFAAIQTTALVLLLVTLTVLVPLRRLRHAKPLRVLRRSAEQAPIATRRFHAWVALLAAGTFGILTPYAVRPAAALELFGALPPDQARLVIPGLRADQAQLLKTRAGSAVILHPTVIVRPDRQAQRLSASCENSLSPGEIILSEQHARNWNVAPGSQLNLRAAGQRLSVNVREVRAMDSLTHFRSGILLSCQAFPRLDPAYEAELHLHPHQEEAILRFVEQNMPGAAVLRPQEYAERMNLIAQRGMLALQLMAFLSMACALLLLGMMVFLTHQRRQHEIAILKVLGARRRQLAIRFARPYALAGSLGGLLGAILAVLLAAGAEQYLLRKPAVLWAWHLIPVGILAAGALSTLVALTALWPMLHHRPLALLRHSL